MPEIIDSHEGELKGIDIFASGRWNGDEYSTEDLDKIVASFAETKDRLKPYLKLGHGQDQKLLREDELPAAGFVQNIYRQGRKILADVTNIPKKIYELIKNKAYNKVSIELYKNIEIEGKVYDLALKAVSLLGGATPAVHNLDDILALYSNENTILAFETKAELKKFEVDLQNINREDIMEKELLEKIELLQKDVEKYTQENTALKLEIEKSNGELTELKKYSEENKAKVESLLKEKKKTEIDEKVKMFVESKKIIPAQAEKLKIILSELPEEKKYTVCDKEFDCLGDVISSFINEGIEVGLPTENTSEFKKSVEDEQVKINKYMAENKVSYKEAAIACATERK